MKKKIEFYQCVIMAVICFSITTSLPCMAENSDRTVEHIISDSAVLDTGDAASVRKMIVALEDMREEYLDAAPAEENVEQNKPEKECLGVLGELREGEWITFDEAVCVRVPADERDQPYVYVMLIMGTDASVIWEAYMSSDVNETSIYET